MIKKWAKGRENISLIDVEALEKRIEKQILEEIQDRSRIGTIWSMKRMAIEAGHSDEWVKMHCIPYLEPRGVAFQFKGQWNFLAEEAHDFLRNMKDYQ